jgi:hypothetical protein
VVECTPLARLHPVSNLIGVRENIGDADLRRSGAIGARRSASE